MTPQFASDNNAGICPEAWDALARANVGHTPGYGDDDWTRRAADAVGIDRGGQRVLDSDETRPGLER